MTAFEAESDRATRKGWKAKQVASIVRKRLTIDIFHMKKVIVMRRILLLSLRAVTLCGLLAVCANFEPALAVTFTVTTVNDSGPGSLRQAILDSNATSTAFNVINFSIGTGAQTISPLSPLPRISNPVTIDGTTQPGYAGKPIIEIEGSQAGSNPGLVISAGFSTIKGLVINRFKSDGIFMFDTNGNTIEGNFIGT